MANKKVWLEGYWFYRSLKKTAIDFIYFIIFFCFYFSVLLKKIFIYLRTTDTTLLTKVRIVKAMVFLVVVYRCECWTIKKSESQRTDAFKLWCWRRPLKIPWTARRPNSQSFQVGLKKNQPWIFLQEGLVLKLQYFGHLMWRADSLEKTLILGKTEGKRRSGAVENEIVR